ncbi:MAG: NAD(P)/FAD-dependent oxidoreductase, partial [Aristaeellaceae bacterium]
VRQIEAGNGDRERLRDCCRALGMTEQEEQSVFNPWGGTLRALAEQGTIAYRAQERKEFCRCPDFVPMEREDALQELLRRREHWQDQPMERLMTGLCVPRLASALCAAAGITWKNRLIGSLKRAEASALANLLTDWPLNIRGVKGFDAAQVTRGGADCREFDPATMASRLMPGLHAAGEVLDVDGDCGGFNLMFAFGSGILAGRNGR